MRKKTGIVRFPITFSVARDRFRRKLKNLSSKRRRQKESIF